MSRHNKGFTLIELMISLVLSLLVVAAATFMFVSSKQSFSTQEGLSDVQESGRTALRVLNTTVRYAGYLQDPQVNTKPSDIFKGATELPLQGTDGVPPTSLAISGGRTDTSTLMVTYFGNSDQGVVSCLGETANDESADKSPVLVTNVFYLTEADTTTGLSSLNCYTRRRNASSDKASDKISTGQPIVDGVADFQVLYLVDSDADGTADKLMKAKDIEASTTPLPAALWRSTKAAQISISFASLNVVNKQSTSNSALDKSGRILRTFSTTIATRNPFSP